MSKQSTTDLPTDQKTHRNSALDVIRGVAIMMVVVTHIYLQDKNAVTSPLAKYTRLFFQALTGGGWTGVDLFFVLSGFLVSGLLFNEFRKTQAIQPGRFLIRRGFKIYPSFIFFILVSFAIERTISYAEHQPYAPIINYVKDLFFLHNYLGGRWQITWSLDVEEAFYFLLTAFFLYCVSAKKLNLKTLISTYIFLVIIGFIGRLYVNLKYPVYNFDTHFTYTHYRLDSLFFGVILSYLYNFEKERLFGFINRYKTVIIMVCVAVILPNFIFPRKTNHWISIFMLTVNPVAFGLLMLVAIESKLTFFKSKTLSFIGKNSYSIYLWHPFINELVYNYISPSTSLNKFFIYVPVYIILSIITGAVITELIENPFLKLRDKMYPSKSKAPIIKA